MRRSVVFYLPGESDLDALRQLEPDRDWREFELGERAWILQTFLRLADAGASVDLTENPAGADVVVFHAKHKRELYRHRRGVRAAILVGVRGDLRDPLIADVQVVQNGRFANGTSRFFVPHWPQPGLRPRDPSRGTRIERIAYKGFQHNLHPDFRSPRWSEFLAARGIDWALDTVAYRGTSTDRGAVEWPEFGAVDLVLAVRPPDPRLHPAKPATKLINAWTAGVPAILGPEHAYRELRRSDLDYVEVSTLADAEAAVLTLLDQPERYAAMVDNGRRRAAAFAVPSLIERWRALLFDQVPNLFGSPPLSPSRRLPLSIRRALRRIQWVARLRPSR